MASTVATGITAVSLAPPSSPAGAQVKWLLTAAAHLPIPDSAVRVHFDAAFLAQVDPTAVNAGLVSAGSLLPGSGAIGLRSIQTNRSERLVATIARSGRPPALTVTLTVDARGLISGLLLRRMLSAPSSWSAVDTAVAAAAPESRMLVARVAAGRCVAIHAAHATTAAPLGSMFKLYVLDALGDAIAKGAVSWNQRVTVTGALKSLPSGQLQNDPDGTRVSVADAADKLISRSDNTAADILINLIGRGAVELRLTTSGMADPARDEPFLTPRELFILKLHDWPALAERYRAATAARRRALLAATIDRLPLPPLTAAGTWTTPRDIDTLEWFASAQDVCRLYASLWSLAARPGLGPLGHALASSDGGLGRDPAVWRTTWFKGGSEPGVLTLSYLASTRTGQTYVVVILTENPSGPIDQGSASVRLLSAVKGAFALAAGLPAHSSP